MGLASREIHFYISLHDAENILVQNILQNILLFSTWTIFFCYHVSEIMTSNGWSLDVQQLSLKNQCGLWGNLAAGAALSVTY